MSGIHHGPVSLSLNVSTLTYDLPDKVIESA